MQTDRRDVKHVRYSSNGKDFGVPAVDIDSELDLETEYTEKRFSN